MSKKYKYRTRMKKSFTRPGNFVSRETPMFDPSKYILVGFVVMVIVAILSCTPTRQYLIDAPINMTPEQLANYEHVIRCGTKVDSGTVVSMKSTFFDNGMIMIQSYSTLKVGNVNGAGYVVHGQLARENYDREKNAPFLYLDDCEKTLNIWVDKQIRVNPGNCAKLVTIFDPRDPSWKPRPYGQN